MKTAIKKMTNNNVVSKIDLIYLLIVLILLYSIHFTIIINILSIYSFIGLAVLNIFSCFFSIKIASNNFSKFIILLHMGIFLFYSLLSIGLFFMLKPLLGANIILNTGFIWASICILFLILFHFLKKKVFTNKLLIIRVFAYYIFFFILYIFRFNIFCHVHDIKTEKNTEIIFEKYFRYNDKKAYKALLLLVNKK